MAGQTEKRGTVTISRKRIREMRRTLSRQKEKLRHLARSARAQGARDFADSLDHEALELGLSVGELARMETGELRCIDAVALAALT